MKLRLCLSGKLRQSPELELFQKYLLRSKKVGKLINFSSINVIEYDGLNWSKPLLEQGSSKGFSTQAQKILLDERGKNISSRVFADILRSYRDNGTQEIIFFIGSANGVPENLYDKFDYTLSLGRMVWPHSLARVMLMEQIYRASTIIAGLPYHKN